MAWGPPTTFQGRKILKIYFKYFQALKNIFQLYSAFISSFKIGQRLEFGSRLEINTSRGDRRFCSS